MNSNLMIRVIKGAGWVRGDRLEGSQEYPLFDANTMENSAKFWLMNW